jgi:pectin methylesterase-like acyl-CoA thioesterase
MEVMVFKCNHASMIIALFVAVSVNSSVLTVSKPGNSGTYSTITAAVNSAKSGDSIIILDFERYMEQVIIDSTKGGIVICSKKPLSIVKPSITYQDKINVGPLTVNDARIDSMITYVRNRAFCSYKTRNVVNTSMLKKTVWLK